MNSTPVLPLSAAVVALVNAVVVCVTAFGLDLSVEQQASISTVTNASVIVVLAFSHWYRAQRHEKERLRSERWSHLNNGED